MQTSTPHQHRKDSGFTLIELSIVLVIIGLIAGGVLVGQDMIKAAEIRSQVAQISGYDQAFNAFRTKYSGMPGDMNNAATFGLFATNQSAATGRGNGNSLIESSGSSASGGYLGEPALAFTHLSQSNMIKDGITNADYTPGAAVAITNAVMPQAKIGRGNRIYPIAVNGVNQYVIANFSGNITNGTGAFATAPADALTPNEAFQIDSKVDDGVPNTGLVRPVTLTTAATQAELAAAGETAASDDGLAAATAGECWNATAVYHTAATTTRDVNGCQLRIRAQF